ncbi:MAG: hypothetical protein EOO61_06740 [Hymenobacter sp.]|nr:MAG: hypothetical protein EOO61_06740 [Hymenobacter sp.]
MKFSLLLLAIIAVTTGLLAQNVGIGTSAPAYKVDVVGKVHSTSDIITDGYLGIGTTTPAYKLQVNDGSMAIFSSTDVKTWYFNYNSTSNYFQLSEGGINRLTVANGGNVGIGTTTPSAKLDVVGTAGVSGDAAIGGNLTVNNGKGILRSWNGAQIKYYTQESTVHAVLPAFGTSIEGTIAWPSGIFTAPPRVLVGDITAQGGTVGTLWRVQLIPYDATTSTCHFRLINTSNGAVDYNITWNIVYLGQ